MDIYTWITTLLGQGATRETVAWLLVFALLIRGVLGVVAKGVVQQRGTQVSSQARLVETMVAQLEARVSEVEKRAEERSDKQAAAHRSEIERLEVLYRAELQKSAEREQRLSERLGMVTQQMEECTAEKREANHRLAQVMAENQNLIGQVAVLKQQVNGVERRQNESEKRLDEVKRQTDRLKLPPGADEA